MSEELDTHHRALKINLDSEIFGTFAEIGAGQEVARWFLQVGGAAGTVAKTMSAYDMKFSDDIYGKGTRYVSRERLLAMLDHEYALLMERLAAVRGAETQFFVFADTVSARNYAGTNECHGWMGVRFQIQPQSEPSHVLLHINMQDPTNLLQQQALGILGVNLMYASFYERTSDDALLEAIFDDLTLERLEIDVVELSGPAFSGVDTRRLGVKLVRGSLAQAVLFDTDSKLVQPSAFLRKRPIVIERGLFETVSPRYIRMLADASARLREDVNPERDPLAIPELSVNPIAGREAPDEVETLRRLSDVFALKEPVLLTRFPEVYHLTTYLRRYTQEPLRFVFGASTMVQIMHEAHYSDLMGGLLEALGHLLGDSVKLYVYPMEADVFRQRLAGSGVVAGSIVAPSEGFVTAESIELAPPVGHLYKYLIEADWIVGLAPPA